MAHLTRDERDCIYRMKFEGASQEKIARTLSRHPSTISRELKRNRKPLQSYSGYYAQRMAEQRRSKRPVQKKLDDGPLKKEVLRLLNLEWSPEQISGRLKQSTAMRISHQTIYSFIWATGRCSLLSKFLRRGGKRYRRRNAGKRALIKGRVSISQRPARVAQRRQFGHWELDLVVGAKAHERASGFILTAVERRSGLLLTSRLTRKDSGRVTKAIVRMFSKLPSSLSRTITVDNGREFAGHLDWTDQSGIKVYFADPFNSGQRATNENTNGLLRQYFPKGQTFHAMTNAALKFATNRINNRPRKRLNYQSPLETLHKQSKIAFQF